MEFQADSGTMSKSPGTGSAGHERWRLFCKCEWKKKVWGSYFNDHSAARPKTTDRRQIFFHNAVCAAHFTSISTSSTRWNSSMKKCSSCYMSEPCHAGRNAASQLTLLFWRKLWVPAKRWQLSPHPHGVITKGLISIHTNWIFNNNILPVWLDYIQQEPVSLTTLPFLIYSFRTRKSCTLPICGPFLRNTKLCTKTTINTLNSSQDGMQLLTVENVLAG